MNQRMRNLLLRLPGMPSLRRMSAGLRQARALSKERRRLSQFKDAKEIFTHHFTANEWGNDESISGPGSTVAYTQNIRDAIPKLIGNLSVRTLLDAPCGDYNWFRLIQRQPPFEYIGGDVVEELVRLNQERFGAVDTHFMPLNIIKDPLPKADLWLCRDCLIHFSTHDIFRTLVNYLNSGIPHLLTTSHPQASQNVDIPTGSVFTLNLRLPPFSFASPLMAINDHIEGYPSRELCLWSREQIAAAMSGNAAFHQFAQHAVV